MSLDRAVVTPPGDETDFSDVGTDGEPEALGEMLGSAISTPVPVDDEEVVYTSASRPSARTAPAAQSTPQRRTAAIIRRTPAPGVPQARSAVEPPRHGQDDGDFGGSTRVAELEEIDARASSMRGDARSKAATAPPPFAFTPAYEPQPAQPPEEDYEIEIDATASEAPAPPPSPEPPAAAPRRTVANVIRRAVQSTGGQPVARRPGAERPAPIDVPQRRADSAIPELASEEDFSDVAAAVGASDDPAELPEPPHKLSSTSPTTPPPFARAHEIEARGDDDAAVIDDMIPTGVATDVDDDDHDIRTTSILEDADAASLDPAASDVYVPLTAKLDEALQLDRAAAGGFVDAARYAACTIGCARRGRGR
jgi:hypothetical protein